MIESPGVRLARIQVIEFLVFMRFFRSFRGACGSVLTVLLGLSGTPQAADELGDLLDVLQEQTELATKTRLNRDYVPGLINSLDARAMQARGMRTVWQALQQVPGVETPSDATGSRQLVIRGQGRTFLSGNVKIMLDGIPMNTASAANAEPVLNLPLAQVERIEVIRGPGSAIHGEFALLGVVNVISRRSGNGAQADWQSSDGYGLSGFQAWESDDRQWRFSFNASAWASDGFEVNSGFDQGQVLGGAPAADSHAPGLVNDQERYRSLIARLQGKGLTLQAHLLEQRNGDQFGINYFLPPDPDHLAVSKRWLGLDAKQRLSLSDSTDLIVNFTLQHTTNNKDGQYAGPASYFLGGPVADVFSQVDLSERRVALQATLLGQLDSHHWLLEMGANHVEVTDSALSLNLDPTLFTSTLVFNAFTPVIPAGQDRWNYFLTLQDEWRLDDVWTLTAGLRADHYDLSGSALSPRLAAVARIDAKHVFKAQYARAFRPETFAEAGGAVDQIEPTTVDAVELAYIYRAASRRLSATLFHQQINHLVVFVDDGINLGFDDVSRARSSGLELEGEQQIGALGLRGNWTWLDTRDQSSGRQIVDSSRWLAKAGASLKLGHGVVVHLDGRFSGAKQRATGDARSALSQPPIFDFGAEWAIDRDLTLGLAVRNLTDAKERYAAPVDTYVNDFIQPGRSAVLRLEYRPH